MGVYDNSVDWRRELAMWTRLYLSRAIRPFGRRYAPAGSALGRRRMNRSYVPIRSGRQTTLRVILGG